MPHIRFDTDAKPSVEPTKPTQGRKRSRDGHIKSNRTASANSTDQSDSTRPKSAGPPVAASKSNNKARVKSNAGKKPEDAGISGGRTQPKARAGQNGSNQAIAKKKESLLAVRKQLPIWSHAARIKDGLKGSSDVMLLVGETGSGKSTQVPQFLVDEPWCDGGCIAITQPRRVAAISLARRVADEMGTPLGRHYSEVGYSVRFDTSVSAKTRIKFLTEGMLLQEMLRDPTLPQYSAVIVDEVHERSVNVDLILGFLRKLVSESDAGKKSRKTPLKVVVMSATADVQGLFKFFDEGFRDTGGSCEPAGQAMDKTGVDLTTVSSDRISTCFIQGRQYPVKTTYLSAPTLHLEEEALKTILRIHVHEPLPGDILVFLTGQEKAESLQKLVDEYAAAAVEADKDLPNILTLPLFAALPQHAQQRVFVPSPPRTRKVILATNIAETSITVPGVRFVIDSGKVKMKHFRNRLNLDSLLEKPISQSSAIQRQGRAGREAPGQCHRLYTQASYDTLDKVTTPEILRCDLSAALLTMKARGIDDPLNFPFLSPPPRESLEKALLQLLYLSALSSDGTISTIGAQIARLPLTPTLGRVLLEAASPSRTCLPAIIDIVAALNADPIFQQPPSEEATDEARTARAALLHREGDHLTLLATVRAYAAENADRKRWCSTRFVSHRAMQSVLDIRKQLREQCIIMNLLARADLTAFDDDDAAILSFPEQEQQKEDILQCLLAGFAMKTARLMPDGSYRTFVGNQTVAVHPSSVLFGRKVEGIVFTEFVYTKKSYARGVSAVRLGWVERVLAPEG